ncbi:MULTISPECIES: hypothetical protein [unclassified Arsenophonus]|uniref:hypothetical protein n=1 Tax=unclassified Arsenophonus TaxID=2627083 RepID=UPI0028640818|nr:hypothetical protein [Arsenophonus sp.]MDR5608997.1 hypothetical protein [Arsenophonus sp.]MDR5613382.1 hypothetical protein [Arsenophonus sp.]
MKRLVKIFAITSVLGISFLAFANKENSSDEKIATNEMCDTQFGPAQPQGSTTENEQKIKICSRF